MTTALRIPPVTADILAGAFLSNGKGLYQVLTVDELAVTLENCASEYKTQAYLPDLLEEPWFLAKAGS